MSRLEPRVGGTKMAPKRSTPPRAAKKEKKGKAAEIIELSSDSESEEPQISTEPEETTEDAAISETYEQPLLRAAGIKYKTDNQQKETESEGTPSSGAKLSFRTKDTGSVKHRHVSIEIPLPTSSMREDGTEADVWKTPMERQHKTFDFSDVEDDIDVFVTPSEGLKKNPLNNPAIASAGNDADEEKEEEEEDSDDDAPPEDISTRAAEAETVKAIEAATKAAEKQAADMKKKRQARDATFKQQAAEKRSPDTQTAAVKPKPEPVEKRKREVPKLLPLEFLDSDDEDDVPRSSDSAANDGTNKRRKTASVDPKLLREPKAKRDQRVGSTVYRVIADRGNGKLAPKAKKQSMNLKEALLRRDRIPQAKTGSFFVNKR